MAAKAFSLLIVDEDREVRECLGDLFRGTGFSIRIAESHDSALQALPEERGGSWPDVVIFGQLPQGTAPAAFLDKLRAERPEALGRSSFIMFPSFRVSVGNTPGKAKPVNACRLSSVSNLVALVHGIADKTHTA